MLKRIFLVVIGLSGALVWGQTEIQYQPKALQKVMQKEGISDFSCITELAVADSIQQNYPLWGKFFEIHSVPGSYKYLYIGRVNSCRAGICSASAEMPGQGDSEYFDFFILFDTNKTVQLVKVFNYQATHGHEITAKGWLKQFIGHDGSEPLQVNKNIDAISGATISVYALTADVEMKTLVLNKLLQD